MRQCYICGRVKADCQGETPLSPQVCLDCANVNKIARKPLPARRPYTPREEEITLPKIQPYRYNIEDRARFARELVQDWTQLQAQRVRAIEEQGYKQWLDTYGGP